ncbi:Acyl-CoA-binding domain-containing protein 1 [Platanthera guangdongensis]|uniref:Acyl-CoA-binding domain-containing protein 1 n=1 Tax=Platanthera guangdongensis TaxID=2320717 RepID=A0ABR2MSB3_9ASPA
MYFSHVSRSVPQTEERGEFFDTKGRNNGSPENTEYAFWRSPLKSGDRPRNFRLPSNSISGDLEWKRREAPERNKEEEEEMAFELFHELLLTAVIPVFLAFLIEKISPPGEIVRRKPDEELRNTDGFGTEVKLRGSDGEISAAAERGGGIVLVFESVEEKRKLADQVGEKDDGFETEEKLRGSEGEIAAAEERGGGIDQIGEKDEEISDEIPEQDVVEQYNAEDLKEEEKEAESSSSDVKIVSTEIESGSLIHGEDEWEGIEMTELDKRFRLVAEYFSSPPGSEALACLSSSAQLELYGLYKIATEGPCYRFHPLSLKSSTRARWYAWAKLGRMTPETAMEQYISLLAKSIPGRVLENHGDAKLEEADDISQNEILNTRHPDTASSLQNQLSPSVAL